MRTAGAKITDFLGKGPSYGKLGESSLVNNSKVRQAGWAAQANVAQMGTNATAKTQMDKFKGLSMIAQAESEADALKAGAKAKADAQQSAGMFGMIGDIAGGIAGLGNAFGGSSASGGWDSGGSGFGSFGDYSGGFKTKDWGIW